MRTRVVGVIVLMASLASSASAGVYSTVDTPEETRLSRDYENVFRYILGSLRTIPDKKPDREPPIRKRYLLLEALGRKGAADLTSLEEQLNYSAVLIRRGKADEAVQFLDPIARERDDDFIVQCQFAMANFQASTAELKGRAADIMEAALQAWPDRFDKVKKEQKTFLEKTLLWEQGLFDQHRKYEVYFQKLVKVRRKKKNLEQPLDPIFDDVRFLAEDGKFAVGRIADADKAKLPKDAIEIVEQLLVWMPNDIRLLRLLAEVFNATAMESKEADKKNDMIVQASLVLRELELLHRTEKNKESEMFAHKKYIDDRFTALTDYVAKMPPRRVIDPEKLPPDVNKDDSLLTNDQILRTPLVGVATGVAVGVFALWQVQEMRRRRQAA